MLQQKFAKNNVVKTCCKKMVQKKVAKNVENQSIILEVSKNIYLHDILSNFDKSCKKERAKILRQEDGQSISSITYSYDF